MRPDFAGRLGPAGVYGGQQPVLVPACAAERIIMLRPGPRVLQNPWTGLLLANRCLSKHYGAGEGGCTGMSTVLEGL